LNQLAEHILSVLPATAMTLPPTAVTANETAILQIEPTTSSCVVHYPKAKVEEVLDEVNVDQSTIPTTVTTSTNEELSRFGANFFEELQKKHENLSINNSMEEDVVIDNEGEEHYAFDKMSDDYYDRELDRITELFAKDFYYTPTPKQESKQQVRRKRQQQQAFGFKTENSVDGTSSLFNEITVDPDEILKREESRRTLLLLKLSSANINIDSLMQNASYCFLIDQYIKEKGSLTETELISILLAAPLHQGFISNLDSYIEKSKSPQKFKR